MSETAEQLEAEVAAGEAPQTEEEFRRRQSRPAQIMRDLLVPALALISGLVIGWVIIAVSSPDFWNNITHGRIADGIGSGVHFADSAYALLFQNAVGSRQAWSESIVQATPLLFMGLSAALSFRSGFFNIGGQGQLLLGALIAVLVATRFPGIPAIIHIPLSLAAGFAGGAFWGMIPGGLKAWTGANEVITTLMMNFIAYYMISYLLITPLWQRPGYTNPQSSTPVPTAQLPSLPGYRVHAGIIVALIAAGVVWWILFQTTFGFELRTVGTNPNAARYAGMSVALTYILVMAIAGGLAGLAGATQLISVQSSLIPDFAGTYGFDAITVALLGRLSPIGVIFAALLLGSLRAGALGMQSVTPYTIIVVIQAVIIAFMTSPYLIRQIFRIREASAAGSEAFSKGWAK